MATAASAATAARRQAQSSARRRRTPWPRARRGRGGARRRRRRSSPRRRRSSRPPRPRSPTRATASPRSRRCPAAQRATSPRSARASTHGVAAVGRAARPPPIGAIATARHAGGPRAPAQPSSSAGENPDDLAALVADGCPARPAARAARDALRRRQPARAHLSRQHPRRRARAGADRRRARAGAAATSSASAPAAPPRRPRSRRGARWSSASARRAPPGSRAPAAADAPPQRAAAWTRAARTNVLPGPLDRARLPRRRSAASPCSGKPIPDALALGPDPSDAGASDPAAPLGAAAQWLVDFDRAVERGMALRIPLAAPTPAAWTGSSCSACARPPTAPRARAASSALLDAHHYTGGLALMRARRADEQHRVRARRRWTPAGDDPAVEPAQRARRRAHHPQLGRHAARAGARHRDRSARPTPPAPARRRSPCERQMRIALWPVTWGYMLDQLAGELSDDAIARRPRALPGERDGGRRAARAAARPPAVRRARGHVAAPVAAARSARPRRPARPAAERARARLARGARAPSRASRPACDLGAVLATAVAMSPVSLHYGARGLSLPGARRRHVRARRRRRCEPIRALGLHARPGARPRRVRPARHAAHRPAGRRPAVGDRAAAGGRRTTSPGSSINGLDARAHRHPAGRRQHAAVRAAAPRAAARLRDRRAAHRPRPRARRAGRGRRARPGDGTRADARGRGSPRRWTA